MIVRIEDTNGQMVTLEGITKINMAVNHNHYNITNVTSQNWKTLATNSGVDQLTIKIHGIITDLPSDELLLNYAIKDLASSYEFEIDRRYTIKAKCLIDYYNRSIEPSKAQEYLLDLSSSGKPEIITDGSNNQ